MNALADQLTHEEILGYNPDTHEDAKGFEMIPEGDYTARLLAWKWRTTKDGVPFNPRVVSLDLEVETPSGPRKARFLDIRYFEYKNRKASSFGDMIKAIDPLTPRTSIADIEEMLTTAVTTAIPFRVRLQHEAEDRDGRQTALAALESRQQFMDPEAYRTEKNAIYNTYRARGRRKFPQTPSGQEAEKWPSGTPVEAKLAIDRFYPKAAS